jgi:hypothetical protein
MFDRGPGSALLSAQEFRSLAEFLEQVTDDLERRAATRQDVIGEAGRAGGTIRNAWRSPVADTMASGFSDFTLSAITAAERSAPAYRGLRDLALEARRTAQVITEVERYEKSWDEQLAANVSEWEARTTAAIGELLPGDDGGASAELTRMHQERTRRTEEASARRAEALARWHAVCGTVAASMRAAIGELDRFATTPPLPALVQPEETAVGRLSDRDFDALLQALPEDQRRHLNQLRGRVRAAEIKHALQAAGLNPEQFRPEDLRRLDPASPEYRRLIELLEENTRRMDDPAFATGYYDALGAEGIRATLGALEMMQFQQRHGLDSNGRPVPPMGNRIEHIITAHVRGFAIATRSPELADDLAELLNAQNPWQVHQLAILSSGPPGTYNPRFLGDAAYRVLVARPDGTGVRGSPIASSELYPPLASPHPLYSDDRMNVNHAIALHAIAGNTEAAWAFVWDGSSVREDAVKAIVLLRNPAGFPIDDRAHYLAYRSGPPTDRLDPLIDGMRRDALAVIDHMLLNAETMGVAQHGQAAAVYSTAMTTVGEGGASGPTKQRVAEHFGRYIEDMHHAMRSQEQASGEGRGMFSRPDIVRYFSETLTEPEAAAKVGYQLTLYAKAVSGDLLQPPGSLAATEARIRLRTVERIGGALLDGATVNEEQRKESLASAAVGAHAALDVTVEGALMALPGAAGPPAEILKNYGHHFIDGQSEIKSGGDPARVLARNMTNAVEDNLANKIADLSSANPTGERPPDDPEAAIIWWFEKHNTRSAIEPLFNNIVAESNGYSDDMHWDNLSEEAE